MSLVTAINKVSTKDSTVTYAPPLLPLVFTTLFDMHGYMDIRATYIVGVNNTADCYSGIRQNVS